MTSLSSELCEMREQLRLGAEGDSSAASRVCGLEVSAVWLEQQKKAAETLVTDLQVIEMMTIV